MQYAVCHALQIFASFGPWSNDALLDAYGFVLEPDMLDGFVETIFECQFSPTSSNALKASNEVSSKALLVAPVAALRDLCALNGFEETVQKIYTIGGGVSKSTTSMLAETVNSHEMIWLLLQTVIIMIIIMIMYNGCCCRR